MYHFNRGFRPVLLGDYTPVLPVFVKNIAVIFLKLIYLLNNRGKRRERFLKTVF